MTSSERSPCLFIAAAMLLSVSGCMPASEQAPLREQVLQVDTPRAFLTCSQPLTLPPPDRKSIGPEGDSLQSGRNGLRIPRSAVPAARQFTLEQEASDTVGVTVNRNVPPVHFATSATLSIDLRGCGNDGDWHVWRMDSTRAAGQRLNTEIQDGRAIALIDSTSVYMIAN